MAVRWFRISFARNAFLRLLAEHGLALETLSVMHGMRAMTDFVTNHKPQHAELDELAVEWAPAGEFFELSVVRRMRRHDQPAVELRLTLGYTGAHNMTSGSSPASTWRDLRELDGYKIVRGSRVRYRTLTQS